MSTPLPKRRRLHDPQTVLKKPFKSPFKTPSKNTASNANTASTQPADFATPATAPPANTPLRQTTTLPTTSTPTPHPSFQPSPSQPRHRPPPPPSSALAPLLARETTRQRHLSRTISSLRSTNDTLSQALALATSTTDVELEALIVKWRDAARAAAEEVFAGSRDRVNGMGGVGAWRERERRQREFREGGFEDEGPAGGQAGGGSESESEEEEEEGLGTEELEGRKMVRERRREARREAEREREWRREEWEEEKKAAEAVNPRVEEEGRDDDSFTMDMMLKTLNIELDIIGWSKTQQRWVG
ncbi:hypothetical protein K490DRAFT_62580 [Saccharata proteae CBS 121410]|uniref:Swi5-dependent recombination DNA repair protein 1 n=1 Tax=Saccharata proteae CBS 121410 TaxID=1314787 RepID=A0A9P4I0K2_9PEZI|nr:hypothetical protein K490DRAFT_62580 [Saccharata proteae CBS 121410]